MDNETFANYLIKKGYSGEIVDRAYIYDAKYADLRAKCDKLADFVLKLDIRVSYSEVSIEEAVQIAREVKK